MSTLILLLMLVQTSAETDGWHVELTNGAEYHATTAQRDGDTWLLGFSDGVVRVRASEIASVRPQEENRPQPVEKTESKKHRFTIEKARFSVELPADYDRAPGDDIVTYVHDDNKHSVRFARAQIQESIWRLGPAIKRHHSESYAGYRTRSERFTQLGEHAAWLLTFSYKKGEQTWIECQGFLVVDDLVLVISVSTPANENQRSEHLVRSIGRSLSVKHSESAKPSESGKKDKR